MNWFDIIGSTLGFLGAVIFSAALLKPKDQLRDENQTYWNGNPFTVREALSSQPYYFVAFVLIIAGFAITLGGKLGIQFAHSNIATSALISTVIALFGFLATALFYIRRIIVHQNRRTQWLKNIFINAVKSYVNDMKRIEGSDNEKEEFARIKPELQKDLSEKYKQIPEPHDEQEQQLVQATASANNARSFRKELEVFLDTNSAKPVN